MTTGKDSRREKFRSIKPTRRECYSIGPRINVPCTDAQLMKKDDISACDGCVIYARKLGFATPIDITPHQSKISSFLKS